MEFIKIKKALEGEEKNVNLRGWVYRERKSKKLIFIVLRDSSGIIQCVIKKDKVKEDEWEIAQNILVESSIKIQGIIRKDERAPNGAELIVEKLELVNKADVFPIKKDQSKELLADNRHLWLRSQKMTATLKIRSTVFGAIHEYFRKQNFYEFQSPIFQSTQCEGGSTLFKVDYFGKPVFLAQTWQLYAEAGIFSLENMYCIAPSFRAEKSKTSRHLTEYWHAEMEMAWCDFTGLQDQGEGLIKYVLKKVLEINKKELEMLERDLNKLKPSIEKSFPRITYDKALKILEEKNNLKIDWGKDLRTIEEDELMKNFDTMVIVTDYPKKVKAFYMKENPENPEVVQGCDFLAPEGYGEIIGCSQREEDLEKIKQRLIDEGEDINDYNFYLDTRRYGSIPHGGFGMGVERLISWICGAETIKDVIPFPRTMRRVTP